MELLTIISVIVLIYGIFKKPSPPKNTDDLYANHDLIRVDRISGMSEKKLREMHRTDVTIFQKK